MHTARALHNAKPNRFIRTVAAMAMILAVTSVIAKPPGGPGGGGRGGPTCTITSPQNDPVSVTTGGSVVFQGVVSDGTAPYAVTWTFEGGDDGMAPAPVGGTDTATETLPSSGDQTAQYDAAFYTAGTFTVTLSATDSNNKRAKSCSAMRTVEVSDGTGNSRPVAQNDEYNTPQDTQLAIAEPGVLSNDNDPDGDPMTAVLVSDVSNGTLTLSPHGGFTYTPGVGFAGSDSFTYAAYDAGGASNDATVSIGVAAADDVSINSTSVNGLFPASPVSELGPVSNPNYTLVAINDLGMHCGDLDTRISSILPLFNVVHAQVVERGINGLPRIMNEDEVDLFYSAASHSEAVVGTPLEPSQDPAIAKAASGQALSSVVNGEVYKTNFYDIAFQAYDAFYPDNVLDLFFNPSNPALNIDKGLPVPDVERFYLEDGELHASQQFMPGFPDPYVDNNPQKFHEHIGNLPFFISFPFGYVASPNFFEAPGVPIAAFDDFGRENPYPLMKVEARLVGGNAIASLDTVVPISGEAECQVCHGFGGIATSDLSVAEASINDPDHGNVPEAVSEEWASDKNILKLHDQKHATSLINGTTEDFPTPGTEAFKPVVCQQCHYTPALDLAQLGPLGPENDFEAEFVNSDVSGGIISSPSVANGRDQFKHKSMSNVMHSHHGTLDASGLSPGESGYDANNLLFTPMPPAINGQGDRRDPITTQAILEETCYSCHPGKRTQCMRGAMANGGLVCQDCHGQMAQVGDDFSRNVQPELSEDETKGPGNFHLAADFYDNPATPRVPWANEPGCGSCHTGYATDNLAGEANVLVNPTDTLGNADSIRLLAAYRTDDTKATPIVPTNKAFAENVVTEDFTPGDGEDPTGNPKLYRVSTGHGGVMCEGCHGSTHAEWPTANPTANDNIAANQLQGHSGYIAECQVCHEPNDASLPLGNNGPHGMHAVSDRYVQVAPDTLGILDDGHGNVLDDTTVPFTEDLRWNTDHKSYRNDGPGCQACHGTDLQGTVLSRTAKHRVIKCKDNKGTLPGCAAGDEYAVIPKGTPVGCGMCHRQKR